MANENTAFPLARPDNHAVQARIQLEEEIRQALDVLRPRVFRFLGGDGLEAELESLRADHAGDSAPETEAQRIGRSLEGPQHRTTVVGLTAQGWTRGMVEHVVIPNINILRNHFRTYQTLRADMAELGRKLDLLRRLSAHGRAERARLKGAERVEEAELRRLQEMLQACQERKAHPQVPEITTFERIERERDRAEAASRRGKVSYYGLQAYIMLATVIFGVDFLANYFMLRSPLITATSQALLLAISITACFAFASHFLGGAIKASFTWGGRKGLRRIGTSLSLWEKTALALGLVGLFLGFYLLIGPRLFLFDSRFSTLPGLGDLFSWIASLFGDGGGGAGESGAGAGKRLDLDRVTVAPASQGVQEPIVYFWGLLMANTVLLVFGIANAVAYHEPVTALPLLRRRAAKWHQVLNRRMDDLRAEIASLADAPKQMGYAERVIGPLNEEITSLKEMIRAYAPEPHCDTAAQYVAERLTAYQMRLSAELRLGALGSFHPGQIRFRFAEGREIDVDRFETEVLRPSSADLIALASDRALMPRLIGQAAAAQSDPSPEFDDDRADRQREKA